MKTAVLNSINNGLIDPETGEVLNIRYLPGRPLSIRFDASRGLFSINGKKPITQKGGSFSFIPCAVSALGIKSLILKLKLFFN